jgi:hypothetical protein
MGNFSFTTKFIATNYFAKANLNCPEPHPLHGTDRTLNLFTNLPTCILLKEEKILM